MDKQAVKNHFEALARDYDQWKEKNTYYYGELKSFFTDHIRPEHRVIEYGCGTGEIIASVDAKEKVGLDIAEAMIRKAQERHPNIFFHRHDCEELYVESGTFDVAILADIVDHIPYIPKLFASVNNSLRPGGKMLISTANPLWNPILKIAEKLGRKMPEGDHRFIPNRELIECLKMRGFRTVKIGAAMLVPKPIPGVSGRINRMASKLAIFHRLCLIQTIVAEKVKDYPGNINN